MDTRSTTLVSVELKSAIVRDPLVVSPDTPVLDGIAQMSGVRLFCNASRVADEKLNGLRLRAQVSCVLVVAVDRLVGILTERDVVRLSAQQHPLDRLAMGEVMVSPVFTLRESAFTDLSCVINLFQHRHIRHLPIVDDQDRLVGLITYESLRRISHPIDLLQLRLVSQVMTREVICAGLDCSMLEIAQRMTDHCVSCVVIVEAEGSPAEQLQMPVGILTERDLVQCQALALNLNLENCTAGEMMSAPIFSVKPADSLWTVRQIMEKHFIRRLVVTGEQGGLSGIVTQSNLLKALHPLEIYKLAEFLEKEVVRLKAEKVSLLESRTVELELQVEARTAALKTKAEREQLVGQIAVQIRSSLSLQKILDTTVAQVRQALGCDRVNIWRFEADWRAIIVAESTDSSLSLVGERIDDTEFKQERKKICRQGWIRVAPDIYTTEMSACYRESLLRLQMRATILAPLLCGDEVWGVLNASESQHPREWRSEEVELLQALSGQLAIALQQATTYEQLQVELSERRQAEIRLRESEQRYVTLAAAAPVGIFRTDAAGRYIYINERWSQIAGLTPAAAAGEGWMQGLHPDDLAWIAEEWEQSVRQNRPFQGEYRFRCPEGQVRWVFGQAVAERDDNGQVIGYVGSITDISDRKAAEQALAAQRDLNHFMADINSQFVDVGLQALDAEIDCTLQRLGEFSQVETSYLFKLDAHLNTISMTHEWCAPGVPSQLEQAQNLAWDGFPWSNARLFAQKEVLSVVSVAELPPEAAIDQGNWRRFNFASIVAAPLVKKNEFTGFIGLAYLSQSRQWDGDTICLLRGVGETIASAQARTRAEHQVYLNEERLRLALKATSQGLYDLDLRTDETIVSPEYSLMLGYDPSDFHETAASWRDRLHPEDREVVSEAYQAYAAGETSQYRVEFRLRTQQGDWKWILSLGKFVEWDADGRPTRMLGTHTDISDLKQAQEMIIHHALHDPLTNLPNRTLLLERLELAIHRASRIENYHYAVLFLDLDRFKVINDSLGHLIGDQLLTTVAQQLKMHLRDADLVARLGGDEFVILLEDISSVEKVLQIVNRILMDCQTPLIINGHEIFIGFSIGIALGTKDYYQASDLIRDADIAMYQAKKQGKNSYKFFDTDMHAQVLSRLTLETDLRKAFERSEFVVHYQPIVDLLNLQLVGFEALVRWRHPTRGVIFPNKFVPVAEETGLIAPLDSWVFYQACQQIVSWKSKFSNYSSLKISINLSAQDLRKPSSIKDIDSTLSDTGLTGDSITLEITESMLIEDIDQTIDLLAQLESRNIQISIDDFGTGYSSLNYLHRLPVHSLKIDCSFIRQMEAENRNYQVVSTIIALGNQLGLTIVAEGIETLQQLQQLQQLGCQLGQGYIFSEPLTANDIEANFLQGNWR
ncbi:MAG: EAL domain-containing protein [Leptolyngbyaceae cyanobacterium MO_188.B28]|nr:EAL domain-containing protein [Leptolyngbyaceae cyanobacterium MO_188.B28]